MRPSAEQFSTAMGALGVGPGKKVVLYDSANSMWAARVWWLLRAFGFDDAAILDGGWTAWRNAGARVSTDQSNYPVTEFKSEQREGVFVDAPEVASAIGATDTVLIDALSPEMFRGEEAPYGRPGHIPGAHNVYAMELVDPETMHFIDEASLHERFAPALENSCNRVIAYCGVGVGAASDAFHLSRLGCKNVAVYDGSLAEWSLNKSLPMVIEG
jgi:thiosulfate/3-mercaptopyruvate sulfurtransferase